jgi:DNA topoisomerase-1
VPDRDKVDTLTLADALELLEAKVAKQGGAESTGAGKARKRPAKTVAKPRAVSATAATARAPRAAKPAAPRTPPRSAAASAKPKPKARSRRTPAK